MVNVGKYIIHGWYGILKHDMFWEKWSNLNNMFLNRCQTPPSPGHSVKVIFFCLWCHSFSRDQIVWGNSLAVMKFLVMCCHIAYPLQRDTTCHISILSKPSFFWMIAKKKVQYFKKPMVKLKSKESKCLHDHLGGGFKHFWFSPRIPGEMIQFD